MAKRIVTLSAVAVVSASSGTVHATDWEALAGSWSLSGLVRQEVVGKTTNDQNPNNQQGNFMNGVTVPNTAPAGIGGATYTRPGALTQHNDLNMVATRAELMLDGKLGENWSAHFKLRAIGDETGYVQKGFDYRRNSYQTNGYQQEFYGYNGKGTLLERAGKNWMVDLPVAYLDYNSGPLWLRLGNQQIAWGESLFFRVADVPNGIDLRRHLILGVASEEYSDSRIPSLGLRGSLRLNESFDLEGFGQKFQPSILPGPNSPYNLVPSQFIVHEQEGFDKVKDNFNFGARLRGSLPGDVGVQAFAVRRNNPDGVFRWTLANGPSAMSGTAFAQGGGIGVFSAQEWFKYASHVRLDGLGALDSVLNDFPGTVSWGANAVAAACGAPSSTAGNVRVDKASASCILDSFFGLMGDLRGHIARDFPRESIYGFGLNHIFQGEPDSWTDQLIGRFEMSYTPNKVFTSPTLRQSYIVKDETQFAFIFEKYQKFSRDFPATYLVAQWLHKTASDMFGRSLEGYYNSPGESPKGMKGFNAVALAALQPSPTLEWRYDFVALTDLHGGWLIQPGVRWKPNKAMQFDLYANVLKSYGNQDHRNMIQGMEFANEVFFRGTYGF